MSEVKVNKISPRSGTTVTLGDSGDTISIPSGVTLDASSGGLAGTLTTAAQPNITSVGTLTSFTSTGIDDNATSTAITINSSEQVAIGTTSHSSGANLTLSGQGFLTSGADSGSIAFGSNTAYQGRIYQDNNSSIFYIENTYGSSSGDIRFKTNGSERVTIEGTGNVGIGTSSPSQKLDVNTGYLQFTNGYGVHFGDSQTRITGYSDTDRLLFVTGNTERVRIDSSGNVGIGTTTPATALDVSGGKDGTPQAITLANGNTTSKISTIQGIYYNTNAQGIKFNVNNLGASEAMRITSGGALCVNGTNANGPSMISSVSSVSSTACYGNLNTAGAGSYYHVFINQGNSAIIGSISNNGNTGTAFNTTSDYRLKENVSYDFDATTRLKQLKPARFNFIANANTTVDGFLAHEVQDIVPEAITGTKDATETKEKVVVNSNGQVIAENIEQADWETGKIADEDGNTQYPTDSTWEATKVVPVYQGIDQAKLVPLLVKTIQELEARITTLENA